MLVTIRVLFIERVSPHSINLLRAKNTYFVLGENMSSAEIKYIFVAEIRHRSKNLREFQSNSLYQPLWEGGLGYQRFPSII